MILNRERMAMLRAVNAGNVQARRRADSRIEAVIHNAPTAAGTPLESSTWGWQRCGPRLRPLIDAGLVADISPDSIGTGPWTYQLTGDGRAALNTAGAV